MAEAGSGKTIQWIKDHARYPHHDWCLIWPFSKTRGYGTFSYAGRRYYAHNFMCEWVHGAPPTEIHEAAHECGDEGCVNPHHLSWKTPTENAMDSRRHGTHVRSRYGAVGKITPEQAEVIRALKGAKTLRELADEYGVSESAISNVWVGKTHYRPSKLSFWTDEEVRQLRGGIASGKNFSEIGREMNKKPHTVSSKAYRLGLKSGQPIQTSH